MRMPLINEELAEAICSQARPSCGKPPATFCADWHGLQSRLLRLFGNKLPLLLLLLLFC